MGVLVLAKRNGLVPLVKPRLEKPATSGYFLSEAIISAALAASGEQIGFNPPACVLVVVF
jgi:predicted nucleic acid-binding protein